MTQDLKAVFLDLELSLSYFRSPEASLLVVSLSTQVYKEYFK